MKPTLAVVAVAALAFAACGGDEEVSPDQLREALVAQGIDGDLADCIVQDLEQELSSEDFDTIARADEELSGVSADLQAILTETVTDCAVGG